MEQNLRNSNRVDSPILVKLQERKAEEMLDLISAYVLKLLDTGSYCSFRVVGEPCFRDKCLRILASQVNYPVNKRSTQLVQTIAILDIVSERLQCEEPILLRDLYYSLRHMFRSQGACTRRVDQICLSLMVPRSSLGIYSSSKGLFIGRKIGRLIGEIDSFSSAFCCLIFDYLVGPFEFCCDESGSSWRSAYKQKHIVPNIATKANAVRVRFLQGGILPTCVVVIEKESIFDQIIKSSKFSRCRCIFVTGKGVPDLATRAFVRTK